MTFDPLGDVVSSQYEEWVYPEPIMDLPGWMANNWQWFDPSIAHRMFWPDRNKASDLDILIAGCGTNQAAVFAYANPDSKVVAIDVSRSSLDHHQYLKNTYSLTNLELHRLPIENLNTLNQSFDLIVSSGVLHHLADPLVGLKSLAGALRPDGVVAIMLYATYGRLGVEMLQSVFRELGLQRDQASVAMVREALSSLPEGHPIQSYIETLDGLYVAALRDLEIHLIRDDPVTQYAPLPSTQLYLEFYAWLVHAGLPIEKLAAGKEFSDTLRDRSYERLGMSGELSERAKQAFLNLGVSFVHSQVDFLPGQPNMFPKNSIDDTAVLLDAVLRHMSVFAEELGWEK